MGVICLNFVMSNKGGLAHRATERARSFSFSFNVVLCPNSMSYLHKWTWLMVNTEPVYAELKYNFLLLLNT